VFDPLAPYRGTVRRFFTVYRHVIGLLAGGAVAYVRALPREQRRGVRQLGPRVTARVVRPFLSRELRALPFPVQLRRRLELLGPTYIKFGQILAIREDLLPEPVTRELQNLFDRLPAIPFAEVSAIIERALGLPLAAVFAEVAPDPIGSASIAQAHLARLATGERVVVKVIKPGIADVIDYDLRLLGAVGGLLERVIPRYTPRRVVAEFAPTRAARSTTRSRPTTPRRSRRTSPTRRGSAFPRIYRQASARDVLTMEFFDGIKPTSDRAVALPEEERRRVIDLGAEAIVRMLYQDGFFHADLHAGQPHDPAAEREGGGVRWASSTSAWSAASRSARGGGCSATSTRSRAATSRAPRATSPTWPPCSPTATSPASAAPRRPVAPVRVGHAPRQTSASPSSSSRAWARRPPRRVVPVEMTLMVKALVTFEGVGRTLEPALDVAAASRAPRRGGVPPDLQPGARRRELWRSAPEMMDLAVQLPGLLSSGFRARARRSSAGPGGNPLAGVRASIFGGALAIAGVLAYVQHAPWWLWAACWAIAAATVLRGR
jgi:ubiquinone biosynthesis protein